MHIDSFINYLKAEKRYSSYTIRAYESDLTQFHDFVRFSGTETEEFIPGHRDIRDWIVQLMENGISPRSVRRKVSAVGSYCRYLVRSGLMEASPLAKVALPRSGKRLPVFLPEEKLNQLLDEHDFGSDFIGTRDRLIIEMLYFTGIRRAELIGLSNSDVDMSGMVIKVHGKGGKERHIPLGPSFLHTLKDYIQKKTMEYGPSVPEESFFVTRKNRRLYPELVYRVVKKYLKLITAGGKRSPHILRHSFATHMLNHGADLNAIKELLGHANLAATQVYTHNSFEKLKNIYKQAHPRA